MAKDAVITVGSLVHLGVAEIKTGPFGTQLHARDYVTEGIPVINVRNVGFGRIREANLEYIDEATAARLSAHLLEAGDIVFGRKGAVERHAYLSKDHIRWFQGSDCIRLRIREPNSLVSPRFVSYCLLREEYQHWIKQQCSHGSTMASLNQDIVGRIELPHIDRRDQDRIADILSAYDDLIENNTKRIKILEEMARSLYREWFESCRSRGRVSSPVTAQTLIDQGALEINDGYRAKNSELGHPGLPFARAGNVNDGFHFEDADLLHESNIPRAGTKVSRAGDVVFTSKGTVGRFAWVRDRTPAFVYSPQLCFWRVLRPALLAPAYLLRWMQSNAFVDQVNRVKGSTAMADYVSLTDQRRMWVDVAEPHRQAAFAEAVAPMDGLVANLQTCNVGLRQTRDLLLPRLISGEVSV